MKLLKNQIIVNTNHLIRKAQSPYEIMKYAIEIIEYENNKKTPAKKLKKLDTVVKEPLLYLQFKKTNLILVRC